MADESEVKLTPWQISISQYIRAGISGLWVNTTEEMRAMQKIKEIILYLNSKIFYFYEKLSFCLFSKLDTLI